jgi:MinD-like ATPase involved in chromosome partitioning or flagellar assembly/tetratricopeptide (TPR) repeat protein
MTEPADGKIVTFYSYKGGTGRTMALANVAWILASSGKRVLVADWDLESPGLHRFFRPFISPATVRSSGGVIDLIRAYEEEVHKVTANRPDYWYEEFARVTQYAFSIGWQFGDGGRLDFLPAGRQNSAYTKTLTSLDWDEFHRRLGGNRFFQALRSDIKRRYDYTLIDSRTGLSDVADICTMHLPDILVDCFTLSDQGIDGAAEVARTIRKTMQRRSLRILPVPMRVDAAEKEKADAGRTLARRRFEGLPAGLDDAGRLRYWSRVEIPYQAYYAYEETLATFGDEPGDSKSLLSAYERLTAEITEGQVRALTPIDDTARRRVREQFQRRPDDSDERVLLRYAPDGELWAEWIATLLTESGIRVIDPPAGPRPDPENPELVRTLTVLTPDYVEHRNDLPPVGYGGALLPVAVSTYDSGPPSGFAMNAAAFVHGHPAGVAAERILRLFDKMPPAIQTDQGPRFPGAEPRIFSALARNAQFTGREEDLARLRAELRTTTRTVVVPLVALRGLGGVGKTQLALEYVYRYRNAYDVVWWVTADPPEFVDSQLADLGVKLGVTSGTDVNESVRSTLDRLARGPERWLIVFDNAERPERLHDFIPSGAGHVLITSRNQEWAQHSKALDVDVFRRRDSIAHLITLGSVSEADADRVADAVGDLPLAIDAAAAWLAQTGGSVDDYLTLLETQGAGDRVEGTWRLSLNRLKKQAPASYRLLQLCSVLASEVAVELAYSDRMAEALQEIDPLVADRAMRPSLVQPASRLSLIRVDRQARQLIVHRMVQSSLRSAMSSEELATTRQQVQLALAAARPDQEVDEQDSWPRFRMLWPHLEASQALDSTDSSVRQLLVDRVRYLWLRGDYTPAEKLGRRILNRWTRQLDAETDQAAARSLSTVLQRLRLNLANVLRDVGQFREAYELDTEAYGVQVRLLGLRHSDTLRTAGSLAADLRWLGSYREARDMDLNTYQTWLEVFGEDHSRTMFAANNLALSYRLLGQFQDARQLDEQVRSRRTQLLGPHHPSTLHSIAALARDVHEAGEYQTSISMQRVLIEQYDKTYGPDHPISLSQRAGLAVSLRSVGQVDEALQTLDDAFRQLLAQHGEENPSTQSCRLTRAGTQLMAGRLTEAARETSAVAAIYRRMLGDTHPHTLVALSNNALVELALGRRAEAAGLAEQVSAGMRERLGAQHSFALAATANHAVCLAEIEELDEALRLMREVADALADTIGNTHPDTLSAVANLAILAGRSGATGPAADPGSSVNLLTRALGSRHPAVRDLTAGRLVQRILDPPAL